MQEKLYLHKNIIIFCFGIVFFLGIIMAYFYWNIEPQETIAGILCGIGISGFLLSFSLKKPK